jgi:hypothetical protein
LAGDLEADPPIRARDHRDFLAVRMCTHNDLLLVVCRFCWIKL